MAASLEQMLNTNASAIASLTQLMTTMATANAVATKSTKELTKAQEILGVVRQEDDKYFNKVGNQVSKYGADLTITGQAVTEFNKRTAILGTSIKKLTANNEKFNLGAESWRTYSEAGGNKFEYLAEFISSGREEITIFGVEAAKARKVLYGWLPPGMFKLMNKFSSVLQLVGGQVRRFSDGGKGARERLEELNKALKTKPEGTKEYEEILEIIQQLEKETPPENIFGTLLNQGMKLKKFLDSELKSGF